MYDLQKTFPKCTSCGVVFETLAPNARRCPKCREEHLKARKFRRYKTHRKTTS